MLHPSAFVVLSDVRQNSAEIPYYGASSTNDLACPRGSLNHLFSRHNAGANLSFLDGHSARFKYDYLCYRNGTRIGDPRRTDVNWGWDGQPVQ